MSTDLLREGYRVGQAAGIGMSFFVIGRPSAERASRPHGAGRQPVRVAP